METTARESDPLTSKPHAAGLAAHSLAGAGPGFMVAKLGQDSR